MGERWAGGEDRGGTPTPSIRAYFARDRNLRAVNDFARVSPAEKTHPAVSRLLREKMWYLAFRAQLDGLASARRPGYKPGHEALVAQQLCDEDISRIFIP